MTEDEQLQAKVEQILEMGFGREQALAALKCNDNNANDAVNFLFMDEQSQREHMEARNRNDEELRRLTGEGFDIPQEEEPHQLATQGHVNITPGILQNKIFPPEYDQSGSDAHSVTDVSEFHDYHLAATSAPPPTLPPRTSSSQHIENVDSSAYNLAGYYNSQQQYYTHINAGYEEEQVQQSPYSIYDDVEKYERKDEAPSVLMPLHGGQYESYLNSLLTMLHGIPSFREAIFHHSFDTLGFHPRWFKGDDVTIPPSASIVKDEQGEEHDLRFLLEIQRIFAFLDGNSGRAFASTKNFTRSFPGSVRQRFGEVESLTDAYDLFYELLTKQLQIAGVHDPARFFQNASNTRGNEDPSHEEPFGLFSIECEDWKKSLHESLSGLLWEPDTNNSITSSIVKLSDILTISIEPNYDHSNYPAIKLEEKIYPQFYTKQFSHVISQAKQKEVEIKREMAKNTAKILPLKHHHGRQVEPALESSIEFLQYQLNQTGIVDVEMEHALENLITIQNNSQQLKEELVGRNEKLKEELLKCDVLKVDTLLKFAEGEVVEPYVLIGLIFNQRCFAYLKKVQGDLLWVRVEHYTQNSTEFSIHPVEFEDLSTYLGRLHREGNLNESFVMVYVRESLLGEIETGDETVIPPSVLEFVAKDKVELEKMLELIDSDSDSDSNVNVDSESDMDSDLIEHDDDSEKENKARNEGADDVDIDVDVDDNDDDYVLTSSQGMKEDDSPVDLIDLDSSVIVKEGEGTSDLTSDPSSKANVPSSVMSLDDMIAISSAISVDKIEDKGSPELSPNMSVDEDNEDIKKVD